MTADNLKKTFWSINPENGRLSPEILDLYLFLEQRGFRKRTISDEIEIYRLDKHLVAQSFTSDAINEVHSYLKNEFKETTSLTVQFPRKGDITYEFKPREVLEKLVKYGWGKLLNENNFNHLAELQVNIKRHTRDKAFFYFKNGMIQITRAGVTFHPYDSMAGQYIYKDVLINRDIQLMKIDEPAMQDFGHRGYDFFDFLHRLAGVPLDQKKASTDEMNTASEKLQYLLRLMGFLLHDYKQQGLTDFCAILCDDGVGGTGKGILVQALRQMTSVAEINGRKEEKFDPLELTERTRIKVYNDIEPSFPFPSVYTEITDQATLRPMFKTPRYIPYADSWKVMITSNHVIRGNSGADIRRQRVFLVNPFFNDKRTVQDHYGHPFFSSQWSEHDWNFFYNTMFECVRFWLDSDYKMSYEDKEYQEMKIDNEYPFELREFVEGLVAAVRLSGTIEYKISELYYQFKENEKYRLSPNVRKMGQRMFSFLLRKYLEEIKVPHDKNHNRTGIWISKK
jgi:hypothetical protein